MLKALIFDLDGLLVDSEPLQYRAFNTVYSQYGPPLSINDYVNWRDWNLTERWASANGLSIDADALKAEKFRVFTDLVESELELKPGAQELVQSAVGSFALSIASGSSLESIRRCLSKFSLLDCFDTLVSSKMVAQGKPAPDVFLEAAARLGVGPRESVVIENSANGLEAARAASMHCVVCPDGFAPEPVESYRGATLLVSSLQDVNLAELSTFAPIP